MKLRQGTFLGMTLLQVMTITIAGAFTVFFMVQQHRTDVREATIRQGSAMGPELIRLLLWDDRVELERSLAQGVKSNPNLSMAFIERDGTLLISDGSEVPASLLGLQDSCPSGRGLLEFKSQHAHRHYNDHTSDLGPDGHILHLVIDRDHVDAELRTNLVVLGVIGLAAIILGTLLAFFTSHRITRGNEILNRELHDTNDHLEEMNARLQQQQAQLIMSEKMASLGQLSAGVAHEINNPVGFTMSNLGTMKEYVDTFRKVSACVQTLRNEWQADGQSDLTEAMKTLEKVWSEEDLEFVFNDLDSLVGESQEGMERVRGIVNNLKTFARQDQQEPELLDLNECLHSTLKMVANELKYKCKVTTEFTSLPHVTGYPGRINQVLTNLLVNASQAVGESGEIHVETAPKGDHLELRISDTGCGIPEEILPKIFDPFFTTKPVGEGTGLGLSISHSIIADHGGTLEVASEVGKGTTFTISLPLSRKQDLNTKILDMKKSTLLETT